jgi:hypothetical protein
VEARRGPGFAHPSTSAGQALEHPRCRYSNSKGKEKEFWIFQKMENTGSGISLIQGELIYLTRWLYKRLVMQPYNSDEGAFEPESP